MESTVLIFFFRNVEEVLAARGEGVQTWSTEDQTLEVTVEDLIGSDRMKQIGQQAREWAQEQEIHTESAKSAKKEEILHTGSEGNSKRTS